MKKLVWDSTLSVDIDEIDADHRRLVELYNILSQSVTEGESPEYIEAVLEELISCTIWHFRHEERLMVKYHYDDMADHKEEHEELIASSRELQEKFRSNDKQLTDEDIDYLEIWLTKHILVTDMKLGMFLNSVM